ADCNVGESDDVKLSVVSSGGQVDFDIDKMRFDAIDRGTPSFEKHGNSETVGQPKGSESLIGCHVRSKRGVIPCGRGVSLVLLAPGNANLSVCFFAPRYFQKLNSEADSAFLRSIAL